MRELLSELRQEARLCLWQLEHNYDKIPSKQVNHLPHVTDRSRMQRELGQLLDICMMTILPPTTRHSSDHSTQYLFSNHLISSPTLPPSVLICWSRISGNFSQNDAHAESTSSGDAEHEG